ncbi:hypothetical protein [Qipengyuania qiaonensis]|uniref:Uncharacterized protein n=1 Tax=Qipengyuania qiaonensis TaxID=2867240 RepID=A0ABS7J640_9SPHN|nr:hypothetical protein [Qipengyuania qiaonensis]MBX7482797.1 hypothetical protein [Qipengyuania qiaonensis]
MAIPAERGWRMFFWAAAAYNFTIGLGAFVLAEWGSPDAVSAVLIFCFGILYALIARQPRRFAPVLLAGLLGKGLVVVMLGPPNWSEGGDPVIGTIVAGDLIFALGFAAYLARYRLHG